MDPGSKDIIVDSLEIFLETLGIQDTFVEAKLFKVCTEIHLGMSGSFVLLVKAIDSNVYLLGKIFLQNCQASTGRDFLREKPRSKLKCKNAIRNLTDIQS